MSVELEAALAESNRRLEATYAQLQRYAGDLNTALRQVAEKNRDVERARGQLHLYARDLQRVLTAERAHAAELESAYYDTVLRLMLASKYRDDETGEHIQRITDYVRVLARHLKLEPSEAEVMASAAALHDVGKIAVDDAILRKPGQLGPEEWTAMQQHTVLGARMLEGSPSPLLQHGHQIALTHHENWDGTGYPCGLGGEDIPLSGRLVAIADRYDAIRSPRPYKPAFEHDRAVRCLVVGDGRTAPEHFDPRILEAFEVLHPEFNAVWQRWQVEDGGNQESLFERRSRMAKGR